MLTDLRSQDPVRRVRVQDFGPVRSLIASCGRSAAKCSCHKLDNDGFHSSGWQKSRIGRRRRAKMRVNNDEPQSIITEHRDKPCVVSLPLLVRSFLRRTGLRSVKEEAKGHLALII
jgi:hypothetical protein